MANESIDDDDEDAITVIGFDTRYISLLFIEKFPGDHLVVAYTLTMSRTPIIKTPI